jgi:hypothetical protein
VLDEFGLVVCGWSATWDPALRSAIARCPSRRFTTWWTTKGELTAEAAQLVAQRHARTVQIESADGFFRGLGERVVALDELSAPHPASSALAVAMLKRHLVDPTQRIRAHDLVTEEVDRVLLATSTGAAVAPPPSGARTYGDMAETVRTRVAALDVATETLVAMLAAGCYWAAADHEALWVKSIERLASNIPDTGTSNWWTEMHRYPALSAFYAAGIGAMAGGREDVMVRLFLTPRIRTHSGSKPAGQILYPWQVLNPEAMHQLTGYERRKNPGSDYLLARLEAPFRNLLPDSKRLEELFDRFEYLLALAYLGREQEGTRSAWAPIGRFGWRREAWGYTLLTDIEREAKAAGPEWLLLRAGLFGGSLDQFLERKAEFDRQAQAVAWS